MYVKTIQRSSKALRAFVVFFAFFCEGVRCQEIHSQPSLSQDVKELGNGLDDNEKKGLSLGEKNKNQTRQHTLSKAQLSSDGVEGDVCYGPADYALDGLIFKGPQHWCFWINGHYVDPFKGGGALKKIGLKIERVTGKGVYVRSIHPADKRLWFLKLGRTKNVRRPLFHHTSIKKPERVKRGFKQPAQPTETPLKKKKDTEETLGF